MLPGSGTGDIQVHNSPTIFTSSSNQQYLTLSTSSEVHFVVGIRGKVHLEAKMQKHIVNSGVISHTEHKTKGNLFGPLSGIVFFFFTIIL